jgi:hypothetical protein
MVEIDHTAAPVPEPAKPILAVHLLEIEERQRKRFSERGERVRTGCAEIDGYVLGGGFERGITVGISGDGNDGRLVGYDGVLPLCSLRKPRSSDRRAGEGK